MFQRIRRRLPLRPGVNYRSFIETCYARILGRKPDDEGIEHWTRLLSSGAMPLEEFIDELFDCDEYKHLQMNKLGCLTSLHHARIQMVRQLPEAKVIVDLGGAAEGHLEGALIIMGYPYSFERLTIVEPPRNRRHEIYKDVCPKDQIPDQDTGRGIVSYLFESMANLASIPSQSVDLVFSGESIEHVTRADAELVFQEARRILKPNGSFCFDTPNRRITKLQVGEHQFINPDHKYEYTHAELSEMLIRNGFHIVEAKGITYMPKTVQTKQFDGYDMINYVGLFDDIENCYLLYYRAMPA